MQRYIILLALLLATCCHAIEMRLTGDSDDWKGPSKSTWNAEYALRDVFLDIDPDNVSDYDVMDVAYRLFHWLADEETDDERFTKNGYCLVAVMWDPVAQMFWASTIPQGPQKQEMIDVGPTVAPAWFAQVQSLVTRSAGIPNAFFHAEDGVYFQWEAFSGFGRVQDGTYSTRMLMAVYGQQRDNTAPRGQPEIWVKQTPRIWSLCGKSDQARVPSCQLVAQNLNVDWVHRPGSRRDMSDTDSENAADYDGSQPTVEDVAAAEAVDSACTLSKSKLRLRARGDASECSSDLNPPPMSASPLPPAAVSSEADLSSFEGESSVLGTASPSFHITTTSSSPATTTQSNVPTISCSMQNEDPDQGINTQYCICDSSVTLPLLSIAATVQASEACAYSTLPSSTTSASTVFASSTGTSTAMHSVPPTVSCSMQPEDPDEGINTQFCICDSSVTMPLLSLAPTAEVTEACAYTSLPSVTISVSTGFASTITNTALCEICSQVAAFGDACTTYSDCLPEAAKASVTVATSPLHVGTLTGDALYTSISNALETICPSVTQTTSSTQCSGTATIKGITYIEDNSIAEDGELEVFAAFSSYNATSLRDAMIQSLAQSAAKSATGGNCYDASYEVLVKRSEAKKPNWLERTIGASVFDLAERDHPYPENQKINVCNMAELALVNYYSQFWRFAPEPGPTDFIEAQYKFKITNGDFLCEFLEILADALVAIEPEFAVGEVELGEELAAVCQDLGGDE